jgi:hippurate hydrolase
MPGFPVGEFAIRSGPLLAATDQFTLTVTGQGGHAAAPHEAVDPNVAGAHILLALQSIASRTVDPLKSVVVSVCAVHSDTDAFNIIPQTMAMSGTIRTLDAEVREMAEAKLRQISDLTAQAHGCTVEIDFERGYPATVNAELNTEYAAKAAADVAGSVDTNTPPIMAGEDFSYMLEERPGAYIMVGNGDGATVHHPAFDFNDDAIPAGCSWFAEMVEQRLPIDA